MSSNAIDLEEVVKRWALEMFDYTKSKDQARIPRDCLMVTISWDRVRFQHTVPQYNEKWKPPQPKAKVLFRTTFSNNTDLEQEYSFKTERATQSCCEVVVEKGFCMGVSMDIKLATPCEVFEANAGFHKETSLTNINGQTIEEELVWGVDSQIKVPPRHKTTASLVIDEDEFSTCFGIETCISGKVHVTLTSLKDNNSFVKAIDGNIVDIMRREIENGLKGATIDRNVVKIDTRGSCKFSFGIQQHVQLNTEPIA